MKQVYLLRANRFNLIGIGLFASVPASALPTIYTIADHLKTDPDAIYALDNPPLVAVHFFAVCIYDILAIIGFLKCWNIAEKLAVSSEEAED